MRNRFNIKILTVGITILFVGVSVFSNVSSRKVINSTYEIIEDNNVITSWDENDEIITRITGDIFCDNYKSDGLFIKKVELWTWGDPVGYLDITGYKRPLYPINDSKFTAHPKHIIANRFIGWIFMYDQFSCSVKGIAIGNIEWRTKK